MDHILSGLFWEGYKLSETTSISDSHLLFRLEPSATACCGHCHQPCLVIHDTTVRQLREQDILSYRLTLELPVRRVRCLTCGIKREWISWANFHSRMTTRMEAYIEKLARLLPIRHVSQLVGVAWHTVKNIDKRRLEREVVEPDWSSIKRLMMDEFALHKGHRYATVVADADSMQVLWVSVGRTRESIRPFFEKLGEHCHQIEAVAMDQNTAFDLEVKHHCPQAEVVYDLFHVVAKYGREVIDRIRVDQANALKEDKSARRAVKRSRWLLLKNRDNLTSEQQVNLDELMKANKALSLVYVLKEQLKELWRASSVWEAFKRWRQWWRLVQESELAPLISFAKKLRPYLRGILASAKYPLHTSALEGINNKIKVIKRMAYGYRDQEYFFLKIKAAFPGH